jgi:hypothetical protein
VLCTAFKNFLSLGLSAKRCNIESKSKAQVSQYVAADNCALRPASFSWGSMNNEAFLNICKGTAIAKLDPQIFECEI